MKKLARTWKLLLTAINEMFILGEKRLSTLHASDLNFIWREHSNVHKGSNSSRKGEFFAVGRKLKKGR